MMLNSEADSNLIDDLFEKVTVGLIRREDERNKYHIFIL